MGIKEDFGDAVYRITEMHTEAFDVVVVVVVVVAVVVVVVVVVEVVVVVPREFISVCVIPAFNNIVMHTVELVLGEVALGRPYVYWLPQTWARIVSKNNVPVMTGHLSNATNNHMYR